MKKQLLSFLVVLTALICFYSCEEKEEINLSQLPFPKGTELSVDETMAIMVLFEEMDVSGTVRFSGYDLKEYKSIFEKYISVSVSWGTDKHELDHVVSAKIGDSEFNYSGVTIPFSAKLSELEDGEEYYFEVIANYGKTASGSSGPVKFFVLPRGPVDLDLKSGNLWSSCNLGAEYPHESGDYYAWAETTLKGRNAQYDWSSYQHAMGANNKLTKYCVYSSYGYNGFVDNKTILDTEDDAAAQSPDYGSGWHTPSKSDWTELIEQCIVSGITINDVSGLLFRSKKDSDNNKKVLFIPNHGYWTDVLVKNIYGYYWTSNLKEGMYFNDSAYNFTVDVYNKGSIGYGNRCFGELIRPVKYVE